MPPPYVLEWRDREVFGRNPTGENCTRCVVSCVWSPAARQFGRKLRPLRQALPSYRSVIWRRVESSSCSVWRYSQCYQQSLQAIAFRMPGLSRHRPSPGGKQRDVFAPSDGRARNNQVARAPERSGRQEAGTMPHDIRPAARRQERHHIRSITPAMMRASDGSARFAAAMISATFTGARLSGKHSSVMIEIPSTFMFI